MLASKAGYGSAWLFGKAHALSVTRVVYSAQVASALVPLVATG
jgi:DNA relaxase NicK